MVRQLNADGTWTMMTDEEARRTMGEDAWRLLTAPAAETMTEGRRALLDRMQAEQDLHEALALSGKTLDDLPVAGDA